MSLARQNNDVVGLSVFDRVADGLLAVRDLDIFTSGRLNACDNIRNDIHGLLKAGIIRCDDGKISQPSADLSHLKTTGAGAVAAAAEDTYKPARIIFAQCLEQALQSHCIVGIVDHQGEFIAHPDHLDPAAHVDLAQGSADIVL